MKHKQKTYLDKGMTNLLILVSVVYAFFVCYCCYMVLNDQMDFGVESIAKNEIIWKVSD